MATILDGKQTSDKIKIQIASKVKEYIDKGERAPHLTAILVGHDGGSEAYVGNKERSCNAVGFTSTVLRFESDITEEKLLSVVKEINEDQNTDGLIVQLPLPKHINENKIIEAISPSEAPLPPTDGISSLRISSSQRISGTPVMKTYL